MSSEIGATYGTASSTATSAASAYRCPRRGGSVIGSVNMIPARNSIGVDGMKRERVDDARAVRDDDRGLQRRAEHAPAARRGRRSASGPRRARPRRAAPGSSTGVATHHAEPAETPVSPTTRIPVAAGFSTCRPPRRIRYFDAFATSAAAAVSSRPEAVEVGKTTRNRISPVTIADSPTGRARASDADHAVADRRRRAPRPRGRRAAPANGSCSTPASDSTSAASASTASHDEHEPEHRDAPDRPVDAGERPPHRNTSPGRSADQSATPSVRIRT